VPITNVAEIPVPDHLPSLYLVTRASAPLARAIAGLTLSAIRGIPHYDLPGYE